MIGRIVRRTRAVGLACAALALFAPGARAQPVARAADSSAAAPAAPGVAAVAAAAAATAAGTAARATSPVRRTDALELWAGIATGSPQWGLLGETPGMSLGMIALRWSRPFDVRDADAATSRAHWEWHVDLIPFARLSPPLVSLRGTGLPCERASLCVAAPATETQDGWFPPGSPIGAGFAPLGLTRRFAGGRRVSPFLAVTGGALVFSERVPTTQATRVNFTASAEAGLRLGPPDEPGVTLTYRFHHLSNAGTAGENPGLASHLVTVGVHRPRRTPARGRSRVPPSS